MKLLITIATIIMLSSTAKANICAQPSEFQALNMRALQSELMVAALSCGQNRQYNWFATTYSPQLRAYGTEIVKFFEKHGARNSDRMLNDFITKMANHASRSSISRPQDQYCGQVASLYTALQRGQFNKVANLANRYYSGWHRVPICQR